MLTSSISTGSFLFIIRQDDRAITDRYLLYFYSFIGYSLSEIFISLAIINKDTSLLDKLEKCI